MKQRNEIRELERESKWHLKWDEKNDELYYDETFKKILWKIAYELEFDIDVVLRVTQAWWMFFYELFFDENLPEIRMFGLGTIRVHKNTLKRVLLSRFRKWEKYPPMGHYRFLNDDTIPRPPTYVPIGCKNEEEWYRLVDFANATTSKKQKYEKEVWDLFCKGIRQLFKYGFRAEDIGPLFGCKKSNHRNWQYKFSEFGYDISKHRSKYVKTKDGWKRSLLFLLMNKWPLRFSYKYGRYRWSHMSVTSKCLNRRRGGHSILDAIDPSIKKRVDKYEQRAILKMMNIEMRNALLRGKKLYFPCKVGWIEMYTVGGRKRIYWNKKGARHISAYWKFYIDNEVTQTLNDNGERWISHSLRQLA